MKKLEPDAPCARCKSAPRRPGRSYCSRCECETVKQSKKNAEKRIKGISKERFERLESWCRNNQIKELAKQLAR